MNIWLFVLRTVPADGLASDGARPSAGTVMTIKGCVYTSTWMATTVNVIAPRHDWQLDS